MRLTDPRMLTAIVLAMMFTGVFAFAVYTASLDSNIFQAPTIKADTFYVGVQTLAQYITAVSPAAAAISNITTPSYLLWVDGATYYYKNGLNGTVTSDANFVILWGSLVASLTNGDSVYVKAGTYPYATVLNFGGLDNVSFIGEKGAILQCSNAIATAGIRFIGTSEDDHDQTLTVRGLTFDNNLLTSGPYFKWNDHLIVEDCHVYDTVNATLRGGIVVSGTTLHPNIDVRILNNHVEFAGGSGISVSYTNSLNISGNYIHDACQFDYPAGGGIQTNLETSWVTITGNVVSGTTKNDGMYLGESTRVGTATNYIHYTVTGNTIILNDLHISATSGIKGYLNEAVITGNTIDIAGTSDGSVGIHITGLHNIVSSNVIKCAGIAWAGIYVDDTVTAGYSTISGNIITGTDTVGIENEQDYNIFADNQVLGISLGLHHIAGADNNSLIGGTFRGCTTDFTDSGAGNTENVYINKTGVYVP